MGIDPDNRWHGYHSNLPPSFMPQGSEAEWGARHRQHDEALKREAAERQAESDRQWQETHKRRMAELEEFGKNISASNSGNTGAALPISNGEPLSPKATLIVLGIFIGLPAIGIASCSVIMSTPNIATPQTQRTELDVRMANEQAAHAARLKTLTFASARDNNDIDALCTRMVEQKSGRRAYKTVEDVLSDQNHCLCSHRMGHAWDQSCRKLGFR